MSPLPLLIFLMLQAQALHLDLLQHKAIPGPDSCSLRLDRFRRLCRVHDVCILLLQQPHGTLGIVFCFITLSYRPGALSDLLDDLGYELLLLYVIHEDVLIQLVELHLLAILALATHT